MAVAGAVIFGADYNTVQTKVVEVLGTGTPFGPGTGLGTGLNSNSYGYNQSVTSTAVSVGAIITASQFQVLADDINKCYVHQNGVSFTGYAASTDSQPFEVNGNVVYAANLNLLDTTINSCLTNRLTINAGQITKTLLANVSYPNSWGGGNAGIITSGVITFSSRAALQYYFNQGGNVNIQAFGSGLSNTTQNTNWNTTLNSTGYVFNATTIASLVPGDVSPTLALNNTAANVATRVFHLENQTGGTGASAYTQNYTRIDANIRYDQAKLYYQVVFYDGSVVAGAAALQAVNATTGIYVYGSAASGAFAGTNPTQTTTSNWAVTTTFAP